MEMGGMTMTYLVGEAPPLAMTGVPEAGNGNQPQGWTPPGEFVSAELQTDCLRFLEDVRRRIEHRDALPHPGT